MKITERRLKATSERAEKASLESIRREAAFITERDRIRAVNDAKTVRLRALRLAQEASDRKAASVRKAAAEDLAVKKAS